MVEITAEKVNAAELMLLESESAIYVVYLFRNEEDSLSSMLQVTKHMITQI
jgi:hypothetical protein